MPQFREIEEVFFSILPEDNHRQHIQEKIQYFEISDWENLSNLAIKHVFPKSEK